MKSSGRTVKETRPCLQPSTRCSRLPIEGGRTSDSISAGISFSAGSYNLFEDTLSEERQSAALLTDLYELTMAAAYFENDFRAKASFELFIRSLPPERNYLMSHCLEEVLDDLLLLLCHWRED